MNPLALNFKETIVLPDNIRAGDGSVHGTRTEKSTPVKLEVERHTQLLGDKCGLCHIHFWESNTIFSSNVMTHLEAHFKHDSQ